MLIEGTLTQVTVDGTRWFRESYLRKRLAVDMTPPLNIDTLQERPQLLQQDDRIARLDAELRPGVRLGESELDVRVQEQVPFFVAVEFNNYQSPSVGEERGLLTVAHRNLTGSGDVLSVTYGRSAGLDLQLDASYTLPLTVRDTTGHSGWGQECRGHPVAGRRRGLSPTHAGVLPAAPESWGIQSPGAAAGTGDVA